MSSAQGQVSPQSLMLRSTMDPNSAAALQLEAAQLGQAQTVQAPTPLTGNTGSTCKWLYCKSRTGRCYSSKS